MNKFYKLGFFLIFTMFFQSTVFSIENDSTNGFGFFKRNVIKETNSLNAAGIKNFPEIPLKILLADTVLLDKEPVYRFCEKNFPFQTFKNTSLTASTNSNYVINWGDGTPDFSASSWDNTTHIYKSGIWILTYSFTAADGSRFSKTYKIYIVNTPAIIVGTDGITDICIGRPYFIPISGIEGNTADTQYTVSFNDGSDKTVYLPTVGGLGGVFHTFTKSSCGASGLVKNAFTMTVKAKNVCAETPFIMPGIFVSTPPIVDISLSAPINPSKPTVYPVNLPVAITNSTTFNEVCVQELPKMVWTISPTTGYILKTGETLGNDYGYDNPALWDVGSPTLNPTFTVPGIYNIKMRLATKRCGDDWKDTTIYVEKQLDPQFSIDKNEGCSPLLVSATNTTDISNSYTTAYKWDVKYAASNCITTPAVWKYTNGTSQSSISPTFEFTTPGIYSLELTMSNTAGSKTVVQTITVKPKPTVTIDNIPDFCGTANFQPVAVVDACAPSSSYLRTEWVFEGGTPASSSLLNPGSISYSSPGKYKVQLTVENLCGTTVGYSNTFEIKEMPVVNAVASQVKCNRELINEIVFSGKYADVFDWTNDNPSIGLAASGTGSISAFLLKNTTNTDITANFTVTPRDAKSGCVGVPQTFSITINPGPEFTQEPVSSSLCRGVSAAPLVVEHIGGVGAPSYQWFSNSVNSDNGGTPVTNSNSKSFVPPTTTLGTIYYYCKLTLSEGKCKTITSKTAMVVVSDAAKISSTTIKICSDSSFIFVRNADDFIPEGTKYTWSTTTISPANSITGAFAQSSPISEIAQQLTNTTDQLATATYIVTPVSGSCVGTNFTVTVIVIPTIKPNATVKNSTCFAANNGSITTDIKGGRPFSSGDSFQILWTGPNGFTATTKDIAGLWPGAYLLTVTDDGGCSISSNFTITEPSAITIVTDVEKDINCNGDANGQISITVTGGTPNYNYKWTKNGNDFSTNEDISNLSPGQYIVQVTDANGCQSPTATFDITESTAIKISASGITHNLCFGDAMGSVLIDVEGGNPIELSPGVFGYRFDWKGPNGFSSNKQNLSNMMAGVYLLTVSDALECSKTFKITITQPDELLLTTEITPVTCFGYNDASIVAHVRGGTKPYNLQWSNFRTDSIQKNLSPGNYIISVTDQNGCKDTLTVNIPEANFSVHSTQKNISCNGAKNGSIHLAVIGGVAPVTLVWQDDPKAGNDRNNLAPGTYTVTLRDGAACPITIPFDIIEPLAIGISSKITDAFACDNPNSGAIDVIVSGGTQPYKYKWSNGAETSNLKDIQPGKYSLVVTDAMGCISKTPLFEVKRQDPLAVYATTTTDFFCETKTFKNTSIASASGGQSPYQFTWSSGTVSGKNNEIMVTNDNNVIVLEVTDALGCKGKHTFTINNPIEIPITKIVSQIVDCKKNTYLFEVRDENLVGPKYTYTWDFGDGKTTTGLKPIHSFLKDGVYKIKLTKSDGVCPRYYEQILVVDPLPHVVLDRVPIFCQGEPTVFYVSGANSYIWSDGSKGDSIILTKKGKYSVIGISRSGCTDTLLFTAENYNLNNYIINVDKNEVASNTPIHLWTKQIPNSEYIWDFGDGIQERGVTDLSHTYTVPADGYYNITLKVINPNGCVEYDTKRIWMTLPTLPAIITPNGDNTNDVFMKGWQIKLFNRNGILIYEGKDGWDGTFKHKLVSAGTYFYMLTYPSEFGVRTKNGYVTVVR